jgi:hypothetical protein
LASLVSVDISKPEVTKLALSRYRLVQWEFHSSGRDGGSKRAVPIFFRKFESLDHCQKQKERQERPMRLFVTYPCQPPGGVTKAERSLFGMAPATPHPALI